MEIGEGVSVGVISTNDEENDWIAFRLIRDDDERSVDSEPFGATLTSSSEDGILNGNGATHFHSLSPGTCSIKFPEFYKGISDWIDEKLTVRKQKRQRR